MKTQKLIVIVAISCVLLSLSGGAAMAELNGCGDGQLINETFDGSLRITGDETCAIISCTIGGNIEVLNLPYILLINNRVGGGILVDGNEGIGTANVIANTVQMGNLTVRDLQIANVIENETLRGNINVNDNVDALVEKNISRQNLECRSNTDLDAFLNFAAETLDCGNLPGKTTLISPTDTITDNTPTYTWNALGSATQYRLWVNDSTVTNVVDQSFSAIEANCVDGTGECSVTPETVLADDTFEWWIQGSNDSGGGPWSDDGVFFTVDTP